MLFLTYLAASLFVGVIYAGLDNCHPHRNVSDYAYCLKSQAYKTNNNGPRMEPCGTPHHNSRGRDASIERVGCEKPGSLVGHRSCEKLGVNIYSDLNCMPVMKNDTVCPIKYECNFEGDDSHCVFKGVTYESLKSGFGIDFTYEKCGILCFCVFSARLICNSKDCPMWTGVDLKPGCYRKYHVNTCCAISQTCPIFFKKIETCDVDGQKYREGEKFNPKYTCLTCICPANFTGELKEPYCQRKSCAIELQDSKTVQRKCAPIVEESEDYPICCPVGWVCPKVSDEIVTINPQVENNPDLICEFGKKKLQLSEGLFSQVNINGTIKDARCECILPPLLLCKETPPAIR